MRRLLTGLASALLLAALTHATPAAAAPAPPGTSLQLMSWNICGSLRASWSCAGYGTAADKIGVIKLHVRDHYVQAMLLQEICEKDLATLMNELGAGWSRSFAPYQYSSHGDLSFTPCGENDSPRQDKIGTAIIIKAGLSSPQTYPTTQPWHGLHRPFHCATATYFNNIRLCNVHLSPVGSNDDHEDWEYADDQMPQIRDVVSDYASVAFGGDFNVVPPDWPANLPGADRVWMWPTGLYYGGADQPGYRECDQRDPLPADPPRTGGTTNVKWGKIDYIFSTQAWRWCMVAQSQYSDHFPMIYSMKIA